jgi:hypothetical protein
MLVVELRTCASVWWRAEAVRCPLSLPSDAVDVEGATLGATLGALLAKDGVWWLWLGWYACRLPCPLSPL